MGRYSTAILLLSTSPVPGEVFFTGVYTTRHFFPDKMALFLQLGLPEVVFQLSFPLI